MKDMFQSRASDTATEDNQAFIQPKAVAQEQSGEATNETEQDCKGWESDPQSFCIKVAGNYLVNDQGVVPAPAALSVEASDDGGCHVNFDDGTICTVQRTKAHTVVVYISPGSKTKLPHKMCTYSYTCSVSGKLDLTRISCS